MLIILYIVYITILCYLNFAVSALSTMQASKRWPLQLCSRLAWFLGMMVLTNLSGCGPGVADHTSNQEYRVRLGMSSETKPVSQNTPATGPVPFVTPFASTHAPASTAQEVPVPLPEYLALPTWIAQALDSPEVSVRLGALDTWAQQGAHASLDPLIVALDDEDDDVRAKAMTIIEQHWVLEQDTEPWQ